MSPPYTSGARKPVGWPSGRPTTFCGRVPEPTGFSRSVVRSERAEEREQGAFAVRRQSGEAVARGAPLAVVREDRLLDRLRPAVVQIRREKAEAPERRRPHLGARRLTL